LFATPAIIAGERKPLPLIIADLPNALAEAGCLARFAGLACRADTFDAAAPIATGKDHPLALLVADLTYVFTKAVSLTGLTHHIANVTAIAAAGGSEKTQDDAACRNNEG